MSSPVQDPPHQHVMVEEEDLLTEEEGYDVVQLNPAFISPSAVITKPLPTPPMDRRPLPGGAGGVVPSLSLSRNGRPQNPSRPAGGLLRHAGELAPAQGDQEDRGRKDRSPRGDGVDELSAEERTGHRSRTGVARPPPPPGAVGFGNIVPPHFELRKTTSVPKQAGLAHRTSSHGTGGEFTRAAMANRSAPTSPRTPAYDTDISSSASTTHWDPKKSWEAQKRRRAVSDAAANRMNGNGLQTYPRLQVPSLSSSSSSLSPEEQQRRVRAESMEYIECPPPPDAADAFDDVDLASGDHRGAIAELACTKSKPASSKSESGSAPVSSARSVISQIEVDRRRKCAIQ